MEQGQVRNDRLNLVEFIAVFSFWNFAVTRLSLVIVVGELVLLLLPWWGLWAP